MLNERQYNIIELMSKSPSPIRADEIAKIVVKSKRTIMRDLSTIKVFLESNNIGELVSYPDQQGYKIKILDNKLYEETMTKSVNDEQIILFQLIMKEYLTIENLADLLFVSRITASEKMGVIKEAYSSTLNISVSNKGHKLDEPTMIKCFLLSNLVDTNLNYYLKMVNISSEEYELLVFQIKHNENMKEYFPNLSEKQIASLFISCLIYKNKDGIGNEDFSYIYEACNITATPETIKNLSLVSDYCIKTNLNLGIKQIKEILNRIEQENDIVFSNPELVNQLYQHLKRVLCYPIFLKSKEIYNISNIKALYPFAFDIGLVFIDYMKKFYNYRIVNSDLIGLYFTLGMDTMMKKTPRVLIYSKSNSIANINRQLIESAISNCKVTISSSMEEILSESFALIVNGTSEKLDLKIPIFQTEYILSENDLTQLKEILENINISNNLKIIFPKEYSFTYNNKKSETPFEILSNICDRLLDSSVISIDEAEKILEREKSGNPLLINDYFIPHCISKRENLIMCIYIHLNHPINIEGTSISHILVTMMNPNRNKSINIFKFLYRYLEAHKDALSTVENYDEFIQFMEK